VEDERSSNPPAGDPEFRWPVINRGVPARAAFGWFRAGWGDVVAAPTESLFYGIVLAVMGALLTRYHDGAIGLAFTTGFLLLGPFLAFGLYAISRQRERGERVVLFETLVAWKANAPSIGFYALMLTLSLAAWIRMSLAVVGLFYPKGAPSLAELLATAGRSAEGVGFLAAYTVAGYGLALFVFATSAIALPMLLDRERMDTISAMITSFGTLRANPKPMLAWAAMIVVLTVFGFATSCIGLVLTIPLVGHAAWHAYRDLVEPESRY
jgi:uncharacterized membrane protein